MIAIPGYDQRYKTLVSAVVSSDFLQTLLRCQAIYQAPQDAEGRWLGPLVGFVGKYKGEDSKYHHWISSQYVNFAKAEENPFVVAMFAEHIAKSLQVSAVIPSCILAAPMGGITLGANLAALTGIPFKFAEDRATVLATKTERKRSVYDLSRHPILPGELVWIVEDVINHGTNTRKLAARVRRAGAEVVGVSSAVNISASNFIRLGGKDVFISSPLRLGRDRYRQDDPRVICQVKAGNLVLKPKNHWNELMSVMTCHRCIRRC